MASDVVISAEGLSKKYLIGHQSAERVPTLRDAMSRTAANFVRTAKDIVRGKPLIAGDEVEEFWALKDVNFEIRRGDVVGIIGRNGAGKSTLLKILSRITEPSEGRVEIAGRVASLLEVGTGFHPELTGRENIFLNGAILGMTRAEMHRKFDEIVDFAEIEKFLDTPVKRYSSGMYVRLAFAIAAHLEPEILIVDEVLAVGDADFQKKCLGKLQDVAGQGRTVLFVSHNIGIIQKLCNSGMYFLNGVLESEGSIEQCVRAYNAKGAQRAAVEFGTVGDRPAIVKISLDENQIERGIIDARVEVSIPQSYRRKLSVGLILKTSTGLPIWGSNNFIHNNINAPRCSGTFHCLSSILPVISDTYFMSVWLNSDVDLLDHHIDVMELVFRHNTPQPSRPAPEVMGYLELPPVWNFHSKQI